MKYYEGSYQFFLGLKTALLDCFGAYDAVTNPSGVEFFGTVSVSQIIFRCPPTGGKLINLYDFSYSKCRYGDEWDGATAVTMPVNISSQNLPLAGVSRFMLGPESIFIMNGTDTVNIFYIISELSNGKHFIGALAKQAVSMANVFGGYILENGESSRLTTLNGIMSSPNGEIYKHKVYISSISSKLPQVNDDGSLAHVKNLWCTLLSEESGPIKGAGYVLSAAPMCYIASNINLYKNNFMVEVDII